MLLDNEEIFNAVRFGYLTFWYLCFIHINLSTADQKWQSWYCVLYYLFQHALNATQDFRIYVGYPGLVYSPCHVNLTFQLYQHLLNLCSTHLQLNFLGFCFNIQQNWWYWLQLFFIHCLPSQPICYLSTSITMITICDWSILGPG